jgi:Tfp pilus assembly PilM family ATPase
MLVKLSEAIRHDVEATVRSKVSQSLIVDVYATAKEIRRKHAEAGIELDDIAASVAALAVQCGCAIEFGKDSRWLGERQPA